ncbi:MAG: 50S ribosomal protein L34 [Candidatus Omnitrophica bacterium]|nr:50S ribosomal protein L34 [Candidatus Omnitrophota bacterium]
MKKHLRPVSRLKRKRTHGFLRRMSTRGGRKTLNRRRRQGRQQLIPE